MTLSRTTISGGQRKNRPATGFNRLMLRTIVFCLVSACLPLAAAALEIDADSQYSFARQLFANQQYLRAAAEFQRFVFFFPRDSRVPEAGLRIARAYLHAGRYRQALKAADKLAHAGYGHQITARAYFLISRCYQLMNSPTQAIATLHNLTTLVRDPAIDDQVAYRLGWIYLEQGNWEKARESFEKVGPERRPDLGIDPILTDLSRADDLPRKNPTLAGVLSLVPGGGQLYCRRYQDALIAFGVNAGLVWAAWESFDEGHQALGTLISFVALGFYMGNIYGAVTDAHKFNRQQTGRFVDTMRRRHLDDRGFVYFRHPGHGAPAAPALALRITF